MPILVSCPCGAKLNAPDSAVGKQVRCPKPGCGKVIPVPAPAAAFEVVDATPVKAPPPPAKKESRADDEAPRKKRAAEDDDDDRPQSRRKRRDDDDDRDNRPQSRRKRRDDDDDDDDRPRRNRGRKRAAGGGGGKGGVIAAIVIGGLVLLGGAGYGIYALLGGGKAAPPEGWKEFTYAEDNFKAYFPKEPQVFGSRDVFKDVPPEMRGMMGDVAVSTTYTCGDGNDTVHISVHIQHFPNGVPAMMRDSMDTGIGGVRSVSGSGVEVRKLRWMGGQALEVVTPQGAMRMAVTDKAVYHATVNGPKGSRASKNEEQGFFDNMVLLK